MTHGSLFSGIGGFDLAAEWMGWENIFHCEINPYGRHVLNYYWPNAISYEDITKTGFTIHRGSIDVLSGGFPCQPYSVAGKRKGKEDERHLWPSMLRAIREISPGWVVGENVRGLISWNGGMVFDEVQADLEAAGYEVLPFLLPACGVNAPHRRDRIWFVAKNTNQNGRRRIVRQKESCIGQFGNIGARDNERLSTNNGEIGAVTDSSNPRTESLQREGKNGVYGFDPFANAGSNRFQGGEQYRSVEAKRSLQAKSGQFSRPVCPNWQNFPTQSPIRNGNDGLPTGLSGITVSKWRKESIKAMGNAVVPQVVLQIFKTIEQYEALFFQNK